MALGLALTAASVQAVEINVGNLLKQALRDAQAKQAQQPSDGQPPATPGSVDQKSEGGNSVASGPLVGKTYTDVLQLPKELRHQGLQDEQSFNLGASNANTWVYAYIAGNGERRILLTKTLNKTNRVLADISVSSVPTGLQFIGSSELAPDDDGNGVSTTCTINSRKATVFGYMKRTGKAFLATKTDLVWSLGADGNLAPAGSGKIACR